MKVTLSFLISLNLALPMLYADQQKDEEALTLYEEPYKRPIGFTLNLGGLSSLSYEGRFMLGLFRNWSLMVSPSFQRTLEIPFYNFKERGISLFNVKRANLGLGLRYHIYDYDSRDHWYFEPMFRGGLTWAGDDEKKVKSFIPSILFGYTAIYEIGYTVSFGLGLEYEFLFGDMDYYMHRLKTSYFGITKLPLTGEFSIGWIW